MKWVALAAAALGGLALVLAALAHQLSWGLLGRHRGPGEIRGPALSGPALAEREARRAAGARARGADPEARRILFGDLHAHTTFSTDAFAASLPILGGRGAHPPADACDFARYCAGLDFWSINDHASNLTPRHWRETVESIRACNARAGDPADPDVVAFLGWEWTQVGRTPATHYGHKNVILLETHPARVPTRPIAVETALQVGGPLGPGALALLDPGGPVQPYLDFARHMRDRGEVPLCAQAVHTRELPDDCREVAPTPAVLFRKLREWGGEAIVIPHGTSWGFYTPPGYAWDAQLGTEHDDPELQPLFEIHSGHGSAEAYRDWRAVEIDEDGLARCPEPRPDYLPSCWRAGEILRERCLAEGLAPATCEARARRTRRLYVEHGNRGFQVVPGQEPDDWLDSGQCRDCFLPAFNHRPGGSAQYVAALGRFDGPGPPRRARFGFLAASDGHKAKPGIGYKQVKRDFFVDGLGFRTRRAERTILERGGDRRASRPVEPSVSGGFGTFEIERTASFLGAGGLTAVHAEGRGRRAIWEALRRREVYGTSGPKILLWFDLTNPPPGADSVRPDGSLPMGSALAMGRAPRFRVRAVGSWAQRPGCPPRSREALGPERLAALCADECEQPSEERRRIAAIEVVRIRPQQRAEEPVGGLIEDPWRVLPCPPDPAGCSVVFEDPEFPAAARDAVYYVRALEEPSPVINAGGLRCRRDAAGRCLAVDACHQNYRTDPQDDCLAEAQPRAWSSPIYVDWAG